MLLLLPRHSEAAAQSGGTVWRPPEPGEADGMRPASTEGTPEHPSCCSPMEPSETPERSEAKTFS